MLKRAKMSWPPSFDMVVYDSGACGNGTFVEAASGCLFSFMNLYKVRKFM